MSRVPLPQTSTGERNYPISRAIHLALCATALAWAAAAYAIAGRGANGFAVRLNLPLMEAPLAAAFSLFLLVAGLQMLDFIATRGRYRAEVLALPRRAGWHREWGMGVAVGWGVCLAAALPILLSGNLHSEIALRGRGSVEGLVSVVAALLLGTLAQEVVFRGYAFQRLTAVTGPGWASVLLSVAFAVFLMGGAPPANLTTAMIDGTLLGLLLAMAWLRTHALWVGWGLHVAYRVVAGVVLGLPIAGREVFGAVTDTFTAGPRWLSGGAYGLDASVLTGLVLLGAMVVLYRVTRDLAWQYTFAPIVPGGYEVTVAPPPAHAAMEKSAAPPPLVQILPAAAPPPLPGRDGGAGVV